MSMALVLILAVIIITGMMFFLYLDCESDSEYINYELCQLTGYISHDNSNGGRTLEDRMVKQ